MFLLRLGFRWLAVFDCATLVLPFDGPLNQETEPLVDLA